MGWWMDGWMDGLVDGWMGGWVGGWMDGWMDGIGQVFAGLCPRFLLDCACHEGI